MIWFVGLEALQAHSREQHFVCEDPVCLETGVMAFETRLELRLHRVVVHGDQGRVEVEFEGPEEEPNWKAEKEARERAARNRLKQAVKRVNPAKVGEVLGAIEAVENGKCRPSDLLGWLGRILGAELDGLFCDVVAAIRVPRARAELVRVRSGMDVAEQDPSRRTEQQSVPVPRPPPNSASRRKGKTKKIVLFES
jgi:hypothetical protein